MSDGSEGAKSEKPDIDASLEQSFSHVIRHLSCLMKIKVRKVHPLRTWCKIHPNSRIVRDKPFYRVL
jgi:hypothetical protein